MKLHLASGLMAFVTGSLVLLGATPAALAMTDVCTLANSDIPTSIRVSDQELASYKSKMARECALSEKYQQMQRKAQQRYGISLEQITQYQAMRYIRRSDYEVARMSNVRPQITYQIFKADYLKPEDQRTTLIWDGFVAGVSQLPQERMRIQSGTRFGFEDLMRVHRGFYRVSNEIGDFAHAPVPGTIRLPQPNDLHWWKLKADEVPKARAILDQINQRFAELGLVPSGLGTLFSGDEDYMNHIVHIKEARDGDGMAIYQGDTRAARKHLDLMLAFVDGNLSQARQGRPMFWEGHLLTPGEVAFLAQQDLVHIHPFLEGNGRVSRFVQEMILTAFSMPHGSSGDMMDNDVLTITTEYYERGISETEKLLLSVDECLEKTYPSTQASVKSEGGAKGDRGARPTKMIDLTTVNMSQIEYGCRLVK